MKTQQFFITVIMMSLILSSCSGESELFNGKDLSNWDKYIGTPLSGFEELALFVSPDDVFSVVDSEEGKVIRISGSVNASLATKESYENYHLKLVYRWGDTVYTRRNSGLLYHSFGEFGEAIGTWMTNIECQLMHGRLGDTYLMNNTYSETSVINEDGRFMYSPAGQVQKFGKDYNGAGIQKAKEAELALGEWNTVELYSYGRTTVHVINGVVTMVNKNTGIIVDGQVKPLSSGKIQIQSEGGELFVKSISIKSISKIPEGII